MRRHPDPAMPVSDSFTQRYIGYLLNHITFDRIHKQELCAFNQPILPPPTPLRTSKPGGIQCSFFSDQSYVLTTYLPKLISPNESLDRQRALEGKKSTGARRLKSIASKPTSMTSYAAFSQSRPWVTCSFAGPSYTTSKTGLQESNLLYWIHKRQRGPVYRPRISLKVELVSVLYTLKRRACCCSVSSRFLVRTR